MVPEEIIFNDYDDYDDYDDDDVVVCTTSLRLNVDFSVLDSETIPTRDQHLLGHINMSLCWSHISIGDTRLHDFCIERYSQAVAFHMISPMGPVRVPWGVITKLIMAKVDPISAKRIPNETLVKVSSHNLKLTSSG